MREIIDPHLHFFALGDGEYHWLKPENPPFWPDKAQIARPFGELDVILEPPLRLAGFVHIEAGFDNARPWRELEWLEQNTLLPCRAVAFADITSHSFSETLNTLLNRSHLCGIRHILDEDAKAILSSKRAADAFSLMAAAGLRFDAQLDLADSDAVNALAKRCEQFPSLPIIINHGAIRGLLSSDTTWKQNLQILAQFPQIAIKLSGWEMADRQWQPDAVATLIRDVTQCFGVSRVMLASNFPLSTWRMPYQRYWQTILDITPAHLHQALCKDNTLKWYGF